MRREKKPLNKLKYITGTFWDLIALEWQLSWVFITAVICFLVSVSYLTSDTQLATFMLKRHIFFDKLYSFPLLDPFVIYLLSFFIVIIQFLRMSGFRFTWNKMQKLKRFTVLVVLSVVSVMLITFLEYSIERLVLKPHFSCSRPPVRIEHMLIRELIHKRSLSNEIKFPEDFPEISLISKALKRVGWTGGNVPSKTILASTLTDPIEREVFDEYYEFFSKGCGSYPNEIVTIDHVNYLKEMKKWFSQDHKLFLTEFLVKPDHLDQLSDSTPSGFLMRQLLVFIFGIMLLCQKKAVKVRAFDRGYKEFIFLLFTMFCLVVVVFSRVYGFRHTIYDFFISLAIVLGLLLILFLLFYRSTKTSLLRLIDNLPGFVYRTDHKKRFTFVNNSFHKVFGTDEHILGKSVYCIYDNPIYRTLLETEIERRSGVANYIVPVKRVDEKRKVFVSIDSCFVDKADPGLGIHGVGKECTKKVELLKGFYQASFNPKNPMESKITFCDEHFARLFGYSSEDLVGTKVIDLFSDPDDRKKIVESLLEKGSGAYEIHCKKQNGSLLKVHSKKHLIFGENEKGKQVAVAIEGVVEQDLFNKAYENSLEGIYVIKTNKKIGYSNIAFQKMFNYTGEELKKLNIEELIDSDYREIVMSGVKDRLSLNSPKVKFDFIAKTKDGKQLPVVTHSKPIVYKGENAILGHMVFDLEKMKAFHSRRSQGVETLVVHDLYTHIQECRQTIKSVKHVSEQELTLLNDQIKKLERIAITYGDMPKKPFANTKAIIRLDKFVKAKVYEDILRQKDYMNMDVDVIIEEKEQYDVYIDFSKIEWVLKELFRNAKKNKVQTEAMEKEKIKIFIKVLKKYSEHPFIQGRQLATNYVLLTFNSLNTGQISNEVSEKVKDLRRVKSKTGRGVGLCNMLLIIIDHKGYMMIDHAKEYGSISFMLEKTLRKGGIKSGKFREDTNCR